MTDKFATSQLALGTSVDALKKEMSKRNTLPNRWDKKPPAKGRMRRTLDRIRGTREPEN